MQYDFIVIGSGIGGLTAASLLAKRGFSVMTLEGSHVAGGCASSYTVKHGGEKFIFEAGATTIVGLDEHQPLRNLETELNITFPVVELSPSMTVHFADKNIIRYKDKSAWIEECYRKFFAETNVSKTQVEKFWQLVFRLSDFVWQVSERNRTFPPRDFNDYWQLATHNSPLDFPKLRFLFKPTLDVIKQHGLDGSSDFVRFCDEQLMITSQATSAQVPFLYAAPCLAYTNSGNFYSYGGILALAETIIQKYKSLGGDIKFREEVTLIARTGNGFKVTTASGNTFESKELVSNATIWNMATLTKGRISEHFRGLSQKFSFGWGAFTMSVAVKNHLPENLTLHHQFVLDAPVPHCNSKSFFISLSAADDRQRQPEGIRLFSVSMHTVAEPWLEPDGQAGESYAAKKAEVEQFIFAHLERHLAGFSQADIVFKTSATPKSWQEWTFRKNGRVGGLPNTMEKNVFDLIAPVTPFKGLYLVGDTVYPGQGIAGVCLSGQNAVHRILNSSQPSRQTPLPTRVSEPVA